MMSINDLLKIATEKGASVFQLLAAAHPILRTGVKLVPVRNEMMLSSRAITDERIESITSARQHDAF